MKASEDVFCSIPKISNLCRAAISVLRCPKPDQWPSNVFPFVFWSEFFFDAFAPFGIQLRVDSNGLPQNHHRTGLPLPVAIVPLPVRNGDFYDISGLSDEM